MALSGFDEGAADYRAGNYKDAFWEWNEAAQQGDVDAQYDLGCLYVRGEGTPQDRASAQKWLRQAADQNNYDAATWLLFANSPTDESRKKYFAAKYKPTDKFHITFVAPQRDGHVMRWPCATDEKDGAQIEFTTGLMFEKGGMGPPRDEKQAAELYRRASDRNFAEAQTHLAYMYTDGRGVEQDLTEAGRLFFKAAEHGNATAQANLGVFYMDGTFGFAKDPLLGYVFVSHAADAGNKLAKDSLPKLVALMSVPDFFKGQELAKEWKPNTPWPPAITERMRSLDSALARAALVWLSVLGTLLIVGAIVVAVVVAVERIAMPRSDTAQQ